MILYGLITREMRGGVVMIRLTIVTLESTTVGGDKVTVASHALDTSDAKSKHVELCRTTFSRHLSPAEPQMLLTT